MLDIEHLENLYGLTLINQLEQDIKDNTSKQKEMKHNLYCLWFPDDRESTILAKLALHDFDLTCDKIVDSVGLNNVSNKQEAIQNAFHRINRQLVPFRIRFDEEYMELKVEEALLQNRLMWAKKSAKDYERDQREIIRTQLKEEKQLQKDKEKAERKLSQLQYEYARKIQRNREKQGTHELEKQIKEYEGKLQQLNHRITYHRCGYVYVVSCNDMKDGFYKIGITRREVKDRVKELTGAGHAFEMNVHGYIYCEDVFGVESRVHNYLTDKRVNKTRMKKEWFYTTLDEIKKAFKESCNIDIDLVEQTDEEYIHAHNIDRRI